MEGYYIINEMYVGVDGYIDYVGIREVKILSFKNLVIILWFKDFFLIFKVWIWYIWILLCVGYLDIYIFNM